MNRPILIALCTFAVVSGAFAVASPAAADSCPYGTVSRFDGVCTSGQGGAPLPDPIVIPPQGASVVTAPGSIGTINGIPCNEKHVDICYAMSQQP